MFVKGGKWPLSWYIQGILYSLLIFYFFCLALKYYKYIYIYSCLEAFICLFYTNEMVLFLFLCFISRNFTNNKFNIFVINNLKNKIKNMEVLKGLEKNIYLKILNTYLKFRILIGTPFIVFFILFFRFAVCMFFLLLVIFNFSIFFKVCFCFVGSILWFFICSILYYSVFLHVLNSLKKKFFTGVFGSLFISFLIGLILSLKRVVITEEQKISLCYRRTFAAYN